MIPYAEDSTDDSHQDIREEVRKLCSRFPGEYWRKLDAESAYPTDFVAALSEAGYLAALIPEEHGGSGLPLSAAAAILEEVQHGGCNAAACHAQMSEAIALLEVDEPISAEVLEKVRALPHIKQAAALRF